MNIDLIIKLIKNNIKDDDLNYNKKENRILNHLYLNIIKMSSSDINSDLDLLLSKNNYNFGSTKDINKLLSKDLSTTKPGNIL